VHRYFEEGLFHNIDKKILHPTVLFYLLVFLFLFSSEAKVINVGVANLPPTFRTDIANKALTLVEQFRALWLSRYEPQGMQSSLLVLSNLLSAFIPDGAKTITVT
jgi:hypothetical protein